jgi:hypothetical protein
MIGLGLGAAYGIVARLMFSTSMLSGLFSVMTLSFIGLVPIAIGILTVRESEHTSRAFRIFAPWVPMSLALAGALILGWEGAICVYLAIPIVYPFASIGGLIGGAFQRRRLAAQSLLLVLPFVAGPLENRVANPAKIITTTQWIEINAPPSVVWPLVASVDSIKPEEQSDALFLSLGFPRPISATLSHPGVGGIRRATFERGLVFTETVTDWYPGQFLRFTIDPNTESIPATTLDAHVTIGGPYFDVLTGSYQLQPSDDGTRTLLILRSTHRVSTHFNLYAGWWAGRIMASIQNNILRVHKARAEGTSSILARAD